MTISVILVAFAFVFETLAAFNVPTPPRFNLIAAGLACFFLSLLLGNFHI
jgi:hypothetical protein